MLPIRRVFESEDGDVASIIYSGTSGRKTIPPDELLGVYAHDVKRFSLLGRGAEAMLGERIKTSWSAIQNVLFLSKFAALKVFHLLDDVLLGRLAEQRVFERTEEDQQGRGIVDGRQIATVLKTIESAWGFHRGKHFKRPVSSSRKVGKSALEIHRSCAAKIATVGLRYNIVAKMISVLDGAARDCLGSLEVDDRIPSDSTQLFATRRMSPAELESVLGQELLTMPDELRIFLGALSEYRRAIHDLASSNLRLVISIARKYRNRGLPIIDLIQAGNSGLLRACNKYDYRRGNKFSTYASWWIRQAIHRELDDTKRLMRLPTQIHPEIQKVESFCNRFLNERSRLPTEQEISKRLKIKVERVAMLLRIANRPIELSLVPKAERERAQHIFSVDALTPFESCWTSAKEEYVSGALSQLDERSKVVITLRFGLGNRPELTLEEVGSQLGVTRERIRQIESKAMQLLWYPLRAALGDFEQ